MWIIQEISAGSLTSSEAAVDPGLSDCTVCCFIWLTALVHQLKLHAFMTQHDSTVLRPVHTKDDKCNNTTNLGGCYRVFPIIKSDILACRYGLSLIHHLLFFA